MEATPSDSPDVTPLPPDPAEPVAAPAPTTAQPTGVRRLGRAAHREIEHFNWRLTLANVLASLLPHLCFARLRTALYRAAGFRIGPRSLLLGRIYLSGTGRIQDRLEVGADVIINAHCFFDLTGTISLGDFVAVGHHVQIITAEHEVGPSACRAGPLHPRAIRVGNGAWIAAGATLLPGVQIGASSVVAAGSVVSGNVPPHRAVGGNPARPLRALPETP